MTSRSTVVNRTGSRRATLLGVASSGSSDSAGLLRWDSTLGGACIDVQRDIVT